MKKFCLWLIVTVSGNLLPTAVNATCDSLITVYNRNYQNHGIMFDVIANSAVMLDHIDANIAYGTYVYRIYYKYGSFLGYETNSAAWTFIDSMSVLSNNTNTTYDIPTEIPINLNLNMAPGDTIALYFMSIPVSRVMMTNDTIPWGTIYSADSVISISTARSVYQLFGTPFSTPSIFNGAVHYCVSSTGVDAENETEDVRIYKAGELLHYMIPENRIVSGAYKITIYDLLSRKIFSEKLQSNTGSFDVSFLKEGIYTAVLTSGEKFIKTVKLN